MLGFQSHNPRLFMEILLHGGSDLALSKARIQKIVNSARPGLHAMVRMDPPGLPETGTARLENAGKYGSFTIFPVSGGSSWSVLIASPKHWNPRFFVFGARDSVSKTLEFPRTLSLYDPKVLILIWNYFFWKKINLAHLLRKRSVDISWAT